MAPKLIECKFVELMRVYGIGAIAGTVLLPSLHRLIDIRGKTKFPYSEEAVLKFFTPRTGGSLASATWGCRGRSGFRGSPPLQKLIIGEQGNHHIESIQPVESLYFVPTLTHLEMGPVCGKRDVLSDGLEDP
jgi:hypothetical protein